MNSTLKHTLSLSLIASTFALGGCASIVSGVHQKITLSTTPSVPARCKLTNDKGTWIVKRTPAVVKVHKSRRNINIICRYAGYSKGTKSVESSTAGMAFGNIFFGGIIGVGADVASGAAFKYPSEIIIDLHKKGSKRYSHPKMKVTTAKNTKKHTTTKKNK